MKDYKGGYVIVDATGLDLGNLGTVTGLYKQVKDAVAVNKPIMLRNVKNGTQNFTPIYAYGGEEVVDGSKMVFLSFFPVTLHISKADVVSM